MNFVEYTEILVNKAIKLIDKDNLLNDNGNKRILLLGAGFNYTANNCVTLPDPKKDIADWITEYRDGPNFKLFDSVIMSRVLEHFPIRQIDWYIYQIYTVMNKGGILICTVPNMKAVADNLSAQFEDWEKLGVDLFKIQRLHFELFSEGPNMWDRHSTWTDLNSIKYYLTMEKLFKIETIHETRVDSTLPPCEWEVVAKRV
jgi:hypothetical protein